jgi:pyruvate kinase
MNRVDFQDTKIVATIGPASDTYEALLELVKEGVDVFRLNFSHGSHEEHKEVINKIKYINEKYRIHIGILADLQGPKLRVGQIMENTILKEGDVIEFTNEKHEGDSKTAYMNYKDFAKDVSPGELVLVDDGKIQLEVLETDGVGRVKLRTKFGGPFKSNKGVNLPQTKVSLPSLTEKDLKDLEFILTQPVNWIALSFVRKADDIIDLQKRIDEAGHSAKTIAKIEKPEAIEQIDEIIKYSNAIMIARGDLGIEVPIEKLPGMQKDIIRRCLRRARPVIVATQMMESMITNPSPSRAEVTDVANAVLDGADAVMLSGETAVGRHPGLVVQAMNKIIAEAEKHYSIRNVHHSTSDKSTTFYSDVLCFNSAAVSESINAEAIIGMTASGYTAFKISSCRPKSKIYIFSESREMLSTLNLVWGVRCFYYGKFTTTDETIQDVNNILKNKGLVRTGDMVVNTGSMPIHSRSRTNMLKLTRIE